MYFFNIKSISKGVKIKIMHGIAWSVNLHSLINVTGMSWCANVSPILTDLDSCVNLFLETSLEW